jgi:hypothetical protein
MLAYTLFIHTLSTQEAEFVGAKVTGKRGIARSSAPASAGEDGAQEGGLVELRAMVPDKEQMSDVYGQPQPPRRKGQSSKNWGSSTSGSDAWV